MKAAYEAAQLKGAVLLMNDEGKKIKELVIGQIVHGEPSFLFLS